MRWPYQTILFYNDMENAHCNKIYFINYNKYDRTIAPYK